MYNKRRLILIQHKNVIVKCQTISQLVEDNLMTVLIIKDNWIWKAGVNRM